MTAPPKYSTLSVRVPQALIGPVKAEANRQDRSVAWIIRDALTVYLDNTSRVTETGPARRRAS